MHHLPNRGFTLVELLVTIAIAAILAAIAVPSYQGFIASNTAESLQSRLATAFVTARVEAATRNQGVSVCASSNGIACTGATTWTNGWIVFTDANSNLTVDAAAGDTVLQVHQQANATYTVAVVNNAAAPVAIAGLAFNNQGFTQNAARARGYVCPPDNNAKYARGITIEPSGRTAKTRDSNADADTIHDYAFDPGDGTAPAPTNITCP